MIEPWQYQGRTACISPSSRHASRLAAVKVPATAPDESRCDRCEKYPTAAYDWPNAACPRSCARSRRAARPGCSRLLSMRYRQWAHHRNRHSSNQASIPERCRACRTTRTGWAQSWPPEWSGPIVRQPGSRPKAGLQRSQAVAGMKPGRGAGTRRVFPLGFAGQPVAPATDIGQPPDVSAGIFHADVDHRPISLPPAFVLGQVVAGAGLDAMAVLIERHFGACQREPRHAHPVLRALVGRPQEFFGRAAHHELAAGNHDHRRACRAIYESLPRLGRPTPQIAQSRKQGLVQRPIQGLPGGFAIVANLAGRACIDNAADLDIATQPHKFALNRLDQLAALRCALKLPDALACRCGVPALGVGPQITCNGRGRALSLRQAPDVVLGHAPCIFQRPQKTWIHNAAAGQIPALLKYIYSTRCSLVQVAGHSHFVPEHRQILLCLPDQHSLIAHRLLARCRLTLDQRGKPISRLLDPATVRPLVDETTVALSSSALLGACPGRLLGRVYAWRSISKKHRRDDNEHNHNRGNAQHCLFDRKFVVVSDFAGRFRHRGRNPNTIRMIAARFGRADRLALRHRPLRLANIVTVRRRRFNPTLDSCRFTQPSF